MTTLNTTATAAILPAASNTTPVAKPSPTDGLANESTFLKLLVAQLKNQNPLNPADGLQFVTQLAQFTSLEQSMQMSTDLHAIRAALEAQAKGPAAGATPPTA